MTGPWDNYNDPELPAPMKRPSRKDFVMDSHLPPKDRAWYVYMVRCADGSYYTGITQDHFRRLDQHNGKRPGGAKYTRSRRPVKMVYRLRIEGGPDAKSWALKREAALKKLSHEQKARYDHS